MLLQRPGLSPYTTAGTTAIQALYAPSNPAFNSIYAISGNKLYQVSNKAASAVIGTVAGDDGLVAASANFDRLAFVAYPNLYLFGATKASTSNSFRNVPVPDGYLAVDVTMLNDYFVIACEDGTFFWLAPGYDDLTSNGNALHFATAQSDPDGLVGVETLNGNLVLFGSRTVETWQPVANADLPFQRTAGQDFARGALSRDSIRKIDNSIIWVGDDAKVYRFANIPQKISTDGIDERLRLRTGPPSAWTFSYDGHLFYVLAIPGQGTFAFDIASQTWSQFQTTGQVGWRPQVGCQTSTGWICGDSQTGAIWALSDASTDAGAAISRRASATVAIAGSPKRVDNIVLDVGCEAACTWNVRWADADQRLIDAAWVPLQADAGSSALSLYRMGAARGPYRTFEIEVTDPVAVRLSGARVGEAWR